MKTRLYLLLFNTILLAGPVFAQFSNSNPIDSLKIIPKIIKLNDNVDRTIIDYSNNEEIGINQVIAPKHWTENIIRLQFEIRGIVLEGKLGLEYKNGTFFYSKDEGFIVPKNTKVRIFNAGDSTLHLIEVLRPGYKPEFTAVFSEF